MEILANFIDVFVQIFSSLRIEYWIQIICLVILSRLIDKLYPKFRGYMGEFWVRQELRRLSGDKYIVLNDIMIEVNGSTHQIDHIVISKYGIFVIETKNYYGLITGNEYKEKWTQHLGKNKFHFKNPIHQNYGHVQSLMKILNLDEKVFIPIVCVSNQAKLKTECQSIVVKLDYLINSITKYKDEVLERNINEISSTIIKLNITDKDKRKEHISNIKDNIKINKEKVNHMICPKCGSPLVERTSKYGKFIGCSSYPRCRYIMK